jgi:Fe2+ transport system protein FeoA
MFRLIDTVNKSKFKIIDFSLDNEQKRRLFNMGIYANDLYERTAGNGTGPIVIRNISSNSNPIAVGRKLAEGIVITNINQ